MSVNQNSMMSKGLQSQHSAFIKPTVRTQSLYDSQYIVVQEQATLVNSKYKSIFEEEKAERMQADNFLRHSDISSPLRIKLCRVVDHLDCLGLLNGELYSDQDTLYDFQLYVKVELLQSGKPAAVSLFSSAAYGFTFNEVVEMPLQVCELGPKSQLAISLYDMSDSERPIASTVLDLVDRLGRLRQGTIDCMLHKNHDPDMKYDTKTPAIPDHPTCVALNNIHRRRENFRSKFQGWQSKSANENLSLKLLELYLTQPPGDSWAFLQLQLPLHACTVVHSDCHNIGLRQLYNFPTELTSQHSAHLHQLHHQAQSTTRTDSAHNAYSAFYKKIKSCEQDFTSTGDVVVSEKPLQICQFHDPQSMQNDNSEQLRQNPITKKYYKMIRLNQDDSQMQPSSEEVKEISEILLQPDFQELTDKQRSLIWRYRFYLQKIPQTLVKFLLSVDWDSESERDQAMKMMTKDFSPVSKIEEATSLLAGYFSLNEYYSRMCVAKQPLTADIVKCFRKIRSHGLKAVKDLDEKAISLIVVQLCQSLRYEEFQKKKLSDLVEFLIERSLREKTLYNQVYWTLYLEESNPQNDINFRNFLQFVLEQLTEKIRQADPDLADSVESSVKLRNQLLSVSQLIKDLKNLRVDEKVQILRRELRGKKVNMMSLDAQQLPHDPNVKVYSVDPDQCRIFKSAVQPIRFMFDARRFPPRWQKGDKMPDMVKVPVVFKNGDDLRQDQLILQMIELIDSFLPHEKLGFTKYKVLAHSSEDGIMEFVSDAKTVQEIIQETPNDFQKHFLELASNDLDRLQKIKENYRKSNAGYAVAMYLLSIGDRHLENLMVTKDGKLFHIDFGFILGKHPPLKEMGATQIRLNEAMISGMGGQSSEDYKKFVSLTLQVFSQLRNHRCEILNLFTLMVDANLPDLPAEDYQNILLKLNDRFMPLLTPEEAENNFRLILQSSINSLMAEFHEKMHIFAVYMKY